MGKIAIVCTSADKFVSKDGSADHVTGTWLEEVASPYWLFTEAGHEVTFVSPAGGKVPLDPASTSGDFYTAMAKKFFEDEGAMASLNGSMKLEEFEKVSGDYGAVYLAGGHGTVADFSDNATLNKVVEAMIKDKIVGAVCHGVIGLMFAKNAAGESILKGKNVTGFSDAEEGPGGVGLHEKVPYSVEAKFAEVGAKYEKKDPWNSCAIVDGNMVTGQNPQSSEEVAKKMIEMLA